MAKRSMPILSGTIPYGDHVQVGDLVYSLDKCRLRFPLKWQQLRVRKGDKPLPLTDDNVCDAVFDAFVNPLYLLSGVSIISGRPILHSKTALYFWSYSSVKLVLEKFKPFGSETYNYSLLLEFNPNKHMDNPMVIPLIRLIQDVLGQDRSGFCWSLNRLDYALDIPRPISEVRLLSRKQGSSYLGTYYFGVRGQTGYTRIYDKRKECIDKKDVYGFDIGREVTRVEYELHKGTPFHMDPPFLLGDLGRYEMLRYVPMNDWAAALRTLHHNTAAKIKKQCLIPVPFDPTIFDGLQQRLLDRLGLTAETNCDHAEKRALDAYEVERDAQALELEQMMSWLSKCVGEND